VKAAGPHRVVHVSDIHLGAEADQQQAILGPLVRALRETRATWEPDASPPLLCITGDLHDSPSGDVAELTRHFIKLLDEIRDALGGPVPTVLLPGNHDRRAHGLLLPYRTSLLDALVTANLPNVVVVGVDPPFLTQGIPDDFHGLPYSLAAIDSSYTPHGLIGAGGVLRTEDILELAQLLEHEPKERPLLLLTHHHLVPTPVTDTSRMDVNTTNQVLRWLAKNVLSAIVPYADHEEWMMTALGAGTALSTLAALGRPVLVLHGHKHFPTVRNLSGTSVGQGDVVLLSAGSAGLALPIGDADDENAAHLWPSFHVLALADNRVQTETVAYYRDGELARRTLLDAQAVGIGWRIHAVEPNIRHGGPHLAENLAHFTLLPSAARTAARWDVAAERIVREHVPPGGEPPLVYREHLRAAKGAIFSSRMPGAPTDGKTRSLDLPTDGTPFTYTLLSGAVRSVQEALSLYGPLGPFEGVMLHNRYQSDRAVLTLSGLPADGAPFGSLIDLTRGQATPAVLRRDDEGRIVLAVEDCPPRTQLRIQWRTEKQPGRERA
jgi:3',5'-cyclic AMP phosphodiesterase CpdA